MSHVCGTPDHLHANGQVCAWPIREITYFEDVRLPGIPKSTVSTVYDHATAAWAAVCGLTFRRVADPAQARIVAGEGPIDGPYRVLALSELPCDADAQSVMHQTFDQAETYQTLDLLQACFVHEIGHALGLQHAPQGSGSIMEPILNQRVSVPQPADVAEVQARYGPPATPAADATDWEALGKEFRAYVLGPLADGLVAAARVLRANLGDPAAIAKMAEIATGLRDQAFRAILWSRLKDLAPAAKAAAFEAIARGLAGAV